jgi:hypothetical protein
MYANLATRKRIPTGANPIVSFGIGRGTSQWFQRGGLSVEGEGMDKPHKLRKISRILMKAFLREDPATPGKRRLFDNFLEHVKKETIPIIALKSGALIMFRDKNMGDKKLLQTLIEPIPPPPVTVKSIRLFFSLNGTEVGPSPAVLRSITLPHRSTVYHSQHYAASPQYRTR